MEKNFAIIKLLLFALCLNEIRGQSGSLTSPVSGSLVAVINSGSVQGQVEFFPDPSTGRGVTIRAKITGGPPGEIYRWKIHEFPAMFDQPNPCSTHFVGRELFDLTAFHGYLRPEEEVRLASNLDIWGYSSILGRSLVLRGFESGHLVCGVISPTSRVTTFRASLHSPVAGEVIVRQSNFGTTIMAQLMYSNGTRKDTYHRWALVQAAEPDSLASAYFNEKSQCSSLRATVLLPISEVVGYVTIGKEPNRLYGRTYFVIPNVKPLDLIKEKVYVVIYSNLNNTDILACAPINFIPPKIAMAKFEKGIGGTVTFEQSSPYDPTIVTIDFEKLEQNAYSYGVDELPLIFRGDDNEVCPNVKGTIFNPMKVDPEGVPPPSKGTMDQYAVGDLSGKYGGLHNLRQLSTHFSDPHLPLFGVNSVVGRALVVYKPNGKPLACANIEIEEKEMVTAFATYDMPIQGQIIFRQRKDEPFGDTSVYIEVSYPPGTTDVKTLNHQWRIHQKPVDTGSRFSTNQCDQAGPHYNPYNVSTANVYSCHCSKDYPLRCQMGDASAKLGVINIPVFTVEPGSEPEVAKYFFTDPFLSLSGPVSIIGRAISIYDQDFGEDQIICSNIVEHRV